MSDIVQIQKYGKQLTVRYDLGIVAIILALTGESFIEQGVIPNEGNWEKITERVNRELNDTASVEDIQNYFLRYFLDNFGTVPMKKCPSCDGFTVPRIGKYGILVGCSNFPKCKFHIYKKRKPHADIV